MQQHFAGKWRWFKIDRREALILLSVVVAAAVIVGVALNGVFTAKAQATVNGEQWRGFGAGWFTGDLSLEMQGMPHEGKGRRGCFGRGFIEVSDEFRVNVIKIAKSDVDVQNLLNEGYNVTRVKPVIKAVVAGDDAVSVKATSAILMREKDATERAIVKVDVENAKVTEIMILTKTVIQK
ncbi:MAG: hypothetical protein RMJ15_08415 [Nitrososphaerota archaeon]|nr:hypothetical protein [Nitrososphaerota archaeon]